MTAVLVHGVGLDRHMWAPFATALGRPTVTYDLIGLGEGPHPPGPYSLDLYSRQLDSVVGESVDADDEVNVIGFSMGALVATRFAIDHPDRVRRLVLVSGVFDRSAAERAAIVERVAEAWAGGYLDSVEPALRRWFTAGFTADHPDVVDSVRQRLLGNDVTGYANAYSVFACGDAELTPLVASIAAPTLIVTGEADERSTPDMARRQAAAMRDATCVIMPGVRHLIPLEAPIELAALVARFLDEGGDDD